MAGLEFNATAEENVPTLAFTPASLAATATDARAPAAIDDTQTSGSEPEAAALPVAEDAAAAAAAADEEDEAEFVLDECCLFTWSARLGVSPNVAVRILFYAIVAFYLASGARRLHLRVSDLEYQRDYEPHLYDASNYVAPLVVDAILFVVLPLGAALYVALLDASLASRLLAARLDAQPRVVALIHLFSVPQAILIVHALLETINTTQQFYLELSSLWFWALLSYRVGCASAYVLAFEFTLAVALTAPLVRQWARSRHARRERRRPLAG